MAKRMGRTWRAATRATPNPGRIVFGVTVASTAFAFLDAQLKTLSRAGADCHVVCADAAGLQEFGERNGATMHALPIARELSLADGLALGRLVVLLRRLRPGTVVMGTPKMGLLGSIAAYLVGCPRRIYLVHGLRYEGARGFGRSILRTVERIICRLSTEVVAVSPSVRARLVADAIVRGDAEVDVVHNGSPNGVDCDRFRPPSPAAKDKSRRDLGLRLDSVVVTFLGRINRDKGLATLVKLAADLAMLDRHVDLVLVGPEEPYDADDNVHIERLWKTPNTHFLGAVENPVGALAATDILVLPTRREGLPTVVLEGGACGVPTVAYAATGTVDCVLDGVTGRLVTQGDSDAFTVAVLELIGDAEQRARLGKASREFIVQRFSRVEVSEWWRRRLISNAS